MIATLCGDNREVMSWIPSGTVELIYADMMFDDPDLSWMSDCARLLAPEGVLYVHTDGRRVCEIRAEGARLGLQLQNWIIWSYNWGGRGTNCWARKHDDILFFSRGHRWKWLAPEVLDCTYAKSTFLGEGLKTRSVYTDVWTDIGVVHKTSKENTGIEWQKPIALLRRIVSAHCAPGDLVLDPFCGTGTTGVACRELGIDCVLIDRIPELVSVARDRVTERLWT